MTERMGVLSSDGRCLQPSPLAARAMLRPAARRLAAVGIGFAGGWAVLYGALMPFGLGLTLGLAEDCFAPCAAGAALGLLLHGLGALSLRSLCQLCALGAAVAARWLLPQRFVPAALAGCGTLTGMALCFALGSSGGADLLLYSAADALLAVSIGFGLRKFAPERPGMGTLLVGAAVAAALGSVRWGWFSPGVLACAAAELALCCRAQKFAALSGSAVLGAALCAADPALAPAAAGLGCATAAAAVLAPGRRVETLAAYAGGCVSGVLCVQPPGNAFGMLFSACGGMAVVCLLPGGWLAPAADISQSGESAPAPARSAAASTRLEAVAQSLSSLAETVNAVYEGLPRRREGFRWVIDNVHDTLCFNCGRRETCWKQEYTATMAGMEALRPLLEQNGSVEAAQLPGQLSRCIHPAALCAAAGRSFALYRSRKEARIHSEAMRTALTEQYSAMATALAQMAARLGRAGLPDPRREARTTQLFASLGLEPLECSVLTDLAGRVTAAVTLPRTSFTPGECRALAEEMGRICRRDFDPPEVTNCRTVTMLHFGERPLYRAVFGLASRPAPPETVSGDACRQFCDSAGRAQMLLCDGMGTGKPAAVDGQMAAKLTAQLLQAGFAAESAARLVNVALGLKNAGQESGATLDLLTLDLYTGRAGLFKAGAAPSFLCRAGVVRTLDGASLPMGVLPTVTGRSTALTLDVGDTVMMVSDGALCDGSAWLCDQLTLSTRLGQSPQQTAEAVAASAVRRSGARQDDITVAIVRLERQKS